MSIYKIGPQWYKSTVTIGKSKHTFFGYSKEDVTGRAMRQLEKSGVAKP